MAEAMSSSYPFNTRYHRLDVLQAAYEIIVAIQLQYSGEKTKRQNHVQFLSTSTQDIIVEMLCNLPLKSLCNSGGFKIMAPCNLKVAREVTVEDMDLVQLVENMASN
ncbi:hypothetical protein HAX54_030744 [Datura stramonium]|uniref:Uncharacterized protein n=1 Tax=Datura stramonium TaxID=4076 RepID=A0ABS8VAF2_DATST|nr:hypothetical protein [Datura stramonium]